MENRYNMQGTQTTRPTSQPLSAANPVNTTGKQIEIIHPTIREIVTQTIERQYEMGIYGGVPRDIVLELARWISSPATLNVDPGNYAVVVTPSARLAPRIALVNALAQKYGRKLELSEGFASLEPSETSSEGPLFQVDFNVAPGKSSIGNSFEASIQELSAEFRRTISIDTALCAALATPGPLPNGFLSHTAWVDGFVGGVSTDGELVRCKVDEEDSDFGTPTTTFSTGAGF